MKALIGATLVATMCALPAFAHHEATQQPSGPTETLPESPKIGKGTGVIQKINQEKGVITIKHGPLQGIVMPAMTMSFLVTDKMMLSTLQPQQEVNFEIAHENGNYVITKIK